MLVWFNGEILPRAEVRIDIEDRGYQFADGVYEVIRLYNGRPFALMPHLERLRRSAEGIQIRLAMPLEELAQQVHRLLERADVKDGMIYMQLTRGCAPRNHIFPDCPPVLLFYARPLPASERPSDRGIKIISLPDERWSKCWIKSIALLANVLAKNEAVRHGAEEAVLIDSGIVTECSSSNFFAVINGKLVTHPVGPKVLPGITRAILLEEAKRLGIEVQERPLTEHEAMAADELFITSTTREIDWVRQWGDREMSPARGPVTTRLHEALRRRVSC